ncbi:MAG TPA: hypothetical protein VK974_03470 [Methylophilaceae bacterium]|nr:hypothetical protein [Methylophilaceae bacterium]
MKAEIKFLKQEKVFWANVRTISQEVGYSDRKTKKILIPTFDQIIKAYKKLNLNYLHICDENKVATTLGATLLEYFEYRAAILENSVKPNLMDKDEAEILFQKLHSKFNPKCPLPFNKQTGEKQKYAFLTGMVNMILEANIKGLPCNFDPRALTTITHNKMPFRTMARRVDGAFPEVVNPIAIWEIKEYYYTTTFGSRVADGVYETLLDGLELEELEQEAQRKIQHVLFIDAFFTWWIMGRSYLCRLVDMLHMGYVDELIIGKEIEARFPIIIKEWIKAYDELNQGLT